MRGEETILAMVFNRLSGMRKWDWFCVFTTVVKIGDLNL